MFALDAATGRVLWSYPSGGSVNAGPVIVDVVVYWGSGYGKFGSWPTKSSMRSLSAASRTGGHTRAHAGCDAGETRRHGSRPIGNQKPLRNVGLASFTQSRSGEMS